MSTVLIQTKYQWPSTVRNPLARSHLIQRLKAGHKRKLTLISAPAGYGKSTLVHLWLASSSEPVAWLSLDANDNDVGVFLRYLVAAVQSVAPTAFTGIATLLDGPQLPPQNSLLQAVAGEVANLSEPLTVVLDDYHVIHNAEIHGLIATGLKYQAPQLHWVLVTRQDLPFSVSRLRASEQMTELRLKDLRFTPEEMHQYLEGLIDEALSAELFDVVAQQTEGWPVGLRLVSLALKDKSNPADFVQAIRGTHRYITEYLMDEVLTQQSEPVQRFLMYTSILDRFCTSLCDVMLEEIWVDEEFSSQAILNQLREANLFLIALDGQDTWFRYHHLFQDLLRHRLQAELNTEQIQVLHTRVIDWLAEHGFLEEALEHALAVKHTAKAVAIFTRQRVDLMNRTHWQLVEQQLNRFPPEIVQIQPELFMAQVWLLYYRGRWDELPAALEHLSMMIDRVELPSETLEPLQGEAETIIALLGFVSGDCDRAITSARFAIDHIPQPVWMVRILAQVVMAVALQANGQLSQAYQSLYQSFEAVATESDLLSATRLVLICFVHWVAADLNAVMREAKQSIALSQKSGSQPMLGVGRYHLGAVLYQQNCLADAEAQFASVTAQPYVYYREQYTYCAIGLALTYQAQNRPNEAQAVADRVLGLMLQTSNTTLLPIVEALQAELALRQGRLSAAIQWAKRQPEMPPLVPMFRPYEPIFTLIKIWLKQNTQTSRRRGAALTTQLIDYLRSTHNPRWLIDAIALQALQWANKGDEAAALTSLEEAVKLAQPGRVIRAFVDLGPEMAALLAQLRLTDPETQGFVQEILTASHPAVKAPAAGNDNHDDGQLTEPLTQRELEVLTLLMQHLVDQEIARELYLSLNTVRTHKKHIYSKLNVHNRRQAARKALELRLVEGHSPS